MSEEKRKKGLYAFIIALLCSIAFAIYRLNWGMADIDETFYLSIPFRLVQGDALLVEEWNLSQLSALLLYPIMKLYLLVFENTEGIIIFFRLAYVVFQTITTIITYWTFKKKNEIIAIITSILWFLFTPFNIMALSYNTMGLMSLWIVVLIEVFNKNKVIYITEGIFLAFAVLCNPYLMTVYLLFIGNALYCYLKYKDRDVIYKIVNISIGAGSIFLIFCCFVFSRASLEEIFKNMKMILTSPAHEPKTIKSFLEPFFNFIKDFKGYVFLTTVFFLIGLLKKSLKKYCFYFSVIISMFLSVYFAVCMTNLHGYASIMIPLTTLGAISFCYSDEKDWKLIWGWIVGMVYVCCANLASNNGIYAIANACTVPSLLSLTIIYKYLKKSVSKKEVALTIGVVVTLQLFSQIYVYGNHVFWEEGSHVLTSEIEQGPLKGIVTIERKKADYDKNYENLMYIKENYATDEEYILLFKEFPSGYLILNEMRMGAYSAWMSDIAEDLYDERIQTYYEYHPEKIPQIIYVDQKSAEVWEYEQWNDYSVQNGYELESFSDGAYFMWRNRHD